MPAANADTSTNLVFRGKRSAAKASPQEHRKHPCLGEESRGVKMAGSHRLRKLRLR